MEQEFLKAFTDIIREQAVQKKIIQVEGLGAFRREHLKQFQEQYSDGRVVMVPPSNVIRFIPE